MYRGPYEYSVPGHGSDYSPQNEAPTGRPEHKARMDKPSAELGLHAFAVLVAAATLALIVAGGLVTSTESGLSVPDWPTTYGHNMFTFPLSKMVGGIRFEHTHRLIASAVGMLTIVLAVWLARREERRWVRRLGYLALATVVAQGVLGGLTVIYLLPTPISVAHGVPGADLLLPHGHDRRRHLAALDRSASGQPGRRIPAHAGRPVRLGGRGGGVPPARRRRGHAPHQGRVWRSRTSRSRWDGSSRRSTASRS